MSQIQSMAILGIRSFSPEEPSYINFFSPLTLIVGPNGSGKTTIIESLRFACTGDSPPNSKGGAFVNDPKIAGTNEVKAQVKLKFYNVNGQKIVCSRSLAVTQKKASVTQKTIDNSLLKYDSVTGEAFSITNRCADIDAELLIHLGVPKAILDNVIFCHQEDSNWPLSESSVLKKKFDDIFSSKRFAVALDNIKDIRKETTQEIRLGNVRLEALKADTAKAKKIRDHLRKLNQQMAAKTETLETIETKITNVEEESNRLNNVLRDIGDIGDQIQQLVNKKEFYESTIRSIESHISPREETTEQLVELLRQHRIKEDQNQEEKVTVAIEKSKLERKLKKVRDDLAQKHLEMGRLQASREEHERQIELRTELIQKINSAYDLDLSVEDGVAASQVFKDWIRENESKNEKIKDEAMSKQNALSDELQILRSRHLSIEENKKHLKKRIEQDKIQIEIITNKIKGFKVSEIELESVKSRMEDYKRKLADIGSDVTESSQKAISGKESELKELDDKISDLNDELAMLSKQGDTRAKLSLKREEKETKETTLKKIYDDCIQDVEYLLKTKPSIANLEKKLDVYKTAKEKELAKLIEVRNKTTRELSASDTKLKMVKQNYDKLRNEAEKFKAIIHKVCGNKHLPNEITAIEKKIEEWKVRIANMDGALMIYKKYSDNQKSGQCCPLCTRDFSDDSEVETFNAQLEQMQSFIPAKQNELKNQLSVLENKKKKLRDAQDTWINLETIRKDLATVKESVDVFEAEKEEATNKADVASTELIEVDNCKIKADKLLLIAGNVNRLYNEVEALNQDIELIENELQFSGSTRTMSDVQGELETLAEKSKTVRREIKRLHTDIDIAYRQKQSVERALNDSKEKLLTLEHQRDFKVGLELQLSELKEQLQEHRNESEMIDEDTSPLRDQVQKTTKEYEQAVKNWREVEEEVSTKERDISRFDERLDEYNISLSKSERATNAEKAGTLKKEMENIEDLINNTSKQITEVEEKLSIIEKDEAERRGVERDLQDQIKYREMQIELENCEDKLKHLNEKLGDYDVNTIKQKLVKAKNDGSELLDKRGSIRGEIVQMRDQIRRYESELSTDYANVDGRYGQLFLDVRTNEIANSDLEKYTKILQTAIMKYHSLKMQNLNKIIKDLWIDTYKGGGKTVHFSKIELLSKYMQMHIDIDYIEIRADNEGTTANRSFNYRVVMVKNGSELNMRGRCSAGQKVLASIIIRLALAETFCVNCGIFTLDEPTTNLDRDNIESLAENLARIIKKRRQQSNLQFVIITHDEEFVEYLSRENILERYYRVQKDQNQHSLISVQGGVESNE
ncbi:MAG: AAA domain-containing protein [Benjaminiella poitrasii]|nr:MAG: AAA domain-containing protein [Benjaminiella poitrasii]